ncbi:hypothetical protein RB594_007694 [Gaeumannomyces avenae]
MNGDLSLSQALGGLRIANPDDAVAPSPPLSGPAVDSNTDYERRAQAQQHPSPQPGLTGLLPEPMLISSHAAGAPDNSLLSPIQSSQSAQMPHQYDMASPGTRSRPTSAVYSSAPAPESEAVSPGRERRPDQARSPMYGGGGGVPQRSSSNAGGYRGNVPTRQASYREGSYNTGGSSHQQMPQPAGGGANPPTRSSSRGMGGGYGSVPIPGIPNAAPSSQPEVPLPASSEEWQERGAAVGVRREVDANGRTVMRSVKKGVRDFSFGRVLGEGSYSTVYQATDRQNLKEYAVKVLEKKHIIKEKKIKYVNIEKNTLNRLTEHPGIVRLYYTFQDETSLYYVLDLCAGGELLGVLKRTGTFDLECTRFYGAQILDAMDYMHARGVIHRDLKPENVLLDDRMHVKITDFGTAKLMPDPRTATTQQMFERDPPDDSRAASFVGTAEYVSPELLTDKSASKASDVWAFGCIVYQLLAGRPPFKGGSEYLTFQKIVGLEYEFPSGFPPAARDLVERCLVLDPARRLTVEHIRNHEFFDGQAISKELWRSRAPRLKPYVPPAQEPHIIQLNGGSSSAQQQVMAPTRSGAQLQQQHSNGGSKSQQQSQQQRQEPRRIITELPPPTQLDLDWSPVLTRNNERILKLGDLMVISSPISNSPHGKGEHGDGHKKLSRFFGGSTTKKRQRLVMVTSSGRIVLAPAGGEEKKTKQEIPLLAADCTWRTQMDVKGQPVWCVDTGGVHYVFEEPKGSQNAGDMGKISVDDWVESLETAKDFALSQKLLGTHDRDNGAFGGDMPSSMSSPASTLGGRANYPEYGEGFSVSDRSGRNQMMNKSQGSLEDPIPEKKRNRFSKRQSKNGLGAAF